MIARSWGLGDARPLAIATAALVLLPVPASAQTIVGRVLDEVNDVPVGGAVVALLDPDGGERTRTLADSAGRFVLRPPEAGEYYLSAERLGYVAMRSPLLALSSEGRSALDLLMQPEPVGLEGFEVSVEAEAHAYLRQFGLSEPQLGNRWIDRADIEAVGIRPHVGRVLEWQSINGMNVIEPEDFLPRQDSLCVSLQRARTAQGRDTCALVVLNGVPVPPQVVLALDTDAVEAMAVLLPTEATLYYGGAGGTGALLVWTRRGG